MHCFECHVLIVQPDPRPEDGNKPTVQKIQCPKCKALYEITTRRLPLQRKGE